VPASASLPELDRAIGPWNYRVRLIYEATPKGVNLTGEMTRWLALLTFDGYELGTGNDPKHLTPRKDRE
jgi:hypothetical protein